MNIKLTTKNNVELEGFVTFLGSHTIAFDVPELSAEIATKLIDIEANLTDYHTYWHVLLATRNIANYELAD